MKYGLSTMVLCVLLLGSFLVTGSNITNANLPIPVPKAGPLDHFVIGIISSPKTAGTVFPIYLTAQDSSNNNITTYTGPATISDKTGKITPTTTGSFTSGFWYGMVNITATSGEEVITVTDGSVTNSSNWFIVDPASLDHFVINTISTPQIAGTAFQIGFTAEDIYNNVDTLYTGPATLSDTTGTISPTTTGTIAYGTWSTDYAYVNKSQVGDIITVSGGGKSNLSNSFTVNPAGLDHLSIGSITTPQTAGSHFLITITAMDPYGNTFSTFVGTVSLTDTTGSITPKITGGFVSGVWSGDVNITKAQSGITITAKYNTTVAGSSNSFTVDSAVLDHFSFNSVSTQAAGTAFTITITAMDVYSNTYTGFTSTVTLSDTTGTISPSTTTPFTSGVWTGSVTVTKSQSGEIITATGGGKGGASNSFTVNPAGLDHFYIVPIISAQTAGTAFTITVTAKDYTNNTITSFVGPATLSDTTGTILPTSATGFSSGIWTHTVTITKAQSGVIITATSGAKTGTSNAFTVNPATLDHFSIGTIVSPQVAGTPFLITITAMDVYGNVYTSFTGPATLIDTTGSITPTTATTFTNGVWTGDVNITKAQSGITITVTGSSKIGVSNSITVSPASMAEFTIVSISSPKIVGISFSITINSADIYGNIVTSFISTATLTDSTGTISPTVTGNFVSGSWTGSVTITKAQTGVTITATSGSIIGTSNAFTMSAAGLAQFYFSTISSPKTAGTVFSITITAKDASNNTATSFTGTATLVDTTGTIKPTTTTSFTNGVWTGNVNITKAQAGVTITATSSSKGGTSNAFTVDSAALDHFKINSIASPKTAGTPFSITITAMDIYNNAVTSFTGPSTIADTTGTITPTTTTSFTAGMWTGNVNITKAQTGVTITTSNATKTGTSNSFTVNSASLNHLYFNTISSPQTAGALFPVTINAKDGYNNTVTLFTGTITLSDSTGTISPTGASITTGVWTGNVNITKAENDVTISASRTGASGTSNSFMVISAGLNHFYFDPISSPQIAGVLFSVTINAKDNYNNTVTSFKSTAALTDTTGTITPTTTGSFTSGSWTGNVNIDKAKPSVSITATSGGKSGTSNAFAVKSIALDHFYFNTIPSPQTAGSNIFLIIYARDSYNNTDSSFTSTATLSDSTGSITSTSTGRFISGVWAGNVTITKAQTGVSITASNGTKSGTSNPFTIDPAALDHFIIDKINSPQMLDVPFSITITAKDAFNNTILTTTQAYLTDSTGTISPMVTTNFISGVWVGNVTISKVQTSITITTSNGTASGTSNAFDVVNSPQGWITGFVYDNITQLPLKGATVSVLKGYSTTTDANGYYNVSASSGSHAVTASKTGYTSDTKTISVTVGQVTQQNFNIRPVQFLTVTVTLTISAVNSSEQSIITITVKDGSYPVQGAIINLASNSGGAFSPSSGYTDGNGIFTSTFIAPNATTQIVCVISAEVTKVGYSSVTKNVDLTVMAPPSNNGWTMDPTLGAGIAILVIVAIIIVILLMKQMGWIGKNKGDSKKGKSDKDDESEEE